jgi:DNA-binding NtrC family response regulator
MTECKPADRGKLLSYHDGLNKAKKALIEEAVRRAGGDHVEAAHLLDIHFTYLYRLMRNLYGES